MHPACAPTTLPGDRRCPSELPHDGRRGPPADADRPASDAGRSPARFDAAVRLGSAVLLWAGLLLVTYWWAAGGGIAGPGRLGRPALTSTGRLTGLLASVLLLAQVLLMARSRCWSAPSARTGWPGCHRLVGFTSFNLMLAHIGADHLGLRRRPAAAHPGARSGT